MSGDRLLHVDVDRIGEHALEASELLKALAHEGRLLILCDLLPGERSVGGSPFATAAAFRATAIGSAQTRRVVSTRSDGRTVYHALANDRVRSIIAPLDASFCAQGNGQSEARRTAPSEGRSPCRRHSSLVEFFRLAQKHGSGPATVRPVGKHYSGGPHAAQLRASGA